LPIYGCKNDTPPALAEQRFCVLHFTLTLETSCSEMRRETALGNAPQERQREIMKFITENGECLARVATSGLHLTDDLKARILSTFLTLMNLRENLDRSNMRSSFGRSGTFDNESAGIAASLRGFSASQVLGSSASKQALGGILYDAYR